MVGVEPELGVLPEREVELAVVGAGAAGLWAAARSARGGRRTLLLEKTPRAGTKILASGGARCNLTTTLDAERAARLFGPAGERFLRPAFRALSPQDVRRHFEALGVPTVEAPLEKVFPASQRARDVRDALERDAREGGAELVFDARVLGVEPRGEGWLVHSTRGRVLAARLVLAAGGKSYPRTGTTGEGYGWLAALGLELVEPVPALVPLVSGASWVRALAGLAVQDVEARLLEVPPGGPARELGRRRRPLLFTHQGVSGPAAMDLSVHVARRAARVAAGEARPPLELAVDLLPGLGREELRADLIAAAGRPGAPRLARALGEGVPRRLLMAVARQAGLEDDNPRVQALDRARRHGWIEALKGLRIPIDGTLGWDQAEVTAGGLALAEVSPATLEVRRWRGLHVVGELLDLSGPIGGLSFQAAFSTAELAARACLAAASPAR